MAGKRQRWTTGAVVVVPLGDGRRAYAQMLEEPEYAFFDVGSREELTAAEAAARPVLFRLWVNSAAHLKGRWPKVGNAPLSEALRQPVLRWNQDPLRPQDIRLTFDGFDGPLGSAADCGGLEQAAVWAPEHAEDRLRSHHDGTPCPWLSSPEPVVDATGPAPSCYVALLRGVNVGRAKRVAMAELRAILEGLGYADVRTVLNSGNAVFLAPGRSQGEVASAVEAAIEERFGFPVRVVVADAGELAAVVAANPIPGAVADPSKFLVAFAADAADLSGAESLLAESWSPDAVALSGRVAYLWCPGGVLESKALQAFNRATGGATTARNWSTVLKIRAAAASVDGGA